ncbi:MAG: sigma-54 dependent transcriptional regulator [Bryobacterales bacterium]|nr:sigma-54 dependent transcriptional regulator [Bryobacteraceae bacterium]MDW8129706.1 sigma-54 dependent transcriptional regulator [Bryobacterales bacterium]
MRLLWLVSEEAHGVLATGCSPVELAGWSVEVVHSAWAALDSLAHSAYEAVLADFPLPEWTAEEWLEEALRVQPLMPVLIREAEPRFERAVRLTRLGAFHYLGDPMDAEQFAALLEQAVRWRRQCERARSGGDPAAEPWRRLLIGESRAIRQIVETIRLVARRRCTVLITGDTGTGKEVVARAIHMASGRGHLPMVAVNCSAIPETLLEAELFGHVKGAFTGAIHHRMGRFEQAHRSTLFLDEIGDMPLDLQAKLLRVLQERELQRLGSSEVVSLDVRVLAASNADLEERIRQGRFREDLYYRLNVVPIHLPPLAERAGDIPLLVAHFLEKVCSREGIPPKRISAEAIERLASYSWPGNVRQLENAVEMAVILSGERELLVPSDFPLPSPAQWKALNANSLPSIRLPDEGMDFERTIARIERSLLEQALRRSNGNKKQAAELLRLKRTTFSAKLKSLQCAVNW